MARQLIVFIVSGFFFAFAANPATADNIGVGKPSANTSSSTTEMTTDDNIGVGEESWYEAFLQLLEGTSS